MGKQPSGPVTPDQMKDQLDKWLKAGKPSTNVLFAPSHGVAVFTGRGRLDLHDTVIIVPIPVLVQVFGNFLQSGVAPILAQIQQTAAVQGALADATGSPDKGA